MLTSFKRTEGAAPAAITDTVQAPVTPVLKESHDHEETSLSSMPSRPLEGEFLPEDFVLPRLNLVQSVGPLSETFQPGAFVYNKEVTLTDGTQPVSLTVLRIRKQYQEYVPYGGEEMPRVFDTLEEVRAAGGWIDWRDNQRPPFSPILNALVLVGSPFPEHPMFPHRFGDADYGLALWTLRSTAFTRAGKAIITASQFALRDGLHLGEWSLTSRREKLGMNFVHVPVLRHGVRHTDPFAAFALSLVG
jgi:hypothetical protein